MRIQQLIARLQEIERDFGDVAVRVPVAWDGLSHYVKVEVSRLYGDVEAIIEGTSEGEGT